MVPEGVKLPKEGRSQPLPYPATMPMDCNNDQRGNDSTKGTVVALVSWQLPAAL